MSSLHTPPAAPPAAPAGLQYKTLAAEFKASSTTDGEYEGYFNTTAIVDDGADIIERGAFIKTISERAKRIKVLLGHDWAKLVGPAPTILQEDSRGLYAKGRLTLGSFWGRETWELLKDDALNEGSIGFETFWDKIELLPNGVRSIKEVKLYEISFVPLGMNPLTDISAVKSLLARSGDTYRALEYLLAEIKAGQRHSKADVALINQLHAMTLELGATTCKGLLGDEPEAAPAADPASKQAAPAALARGLRLRAAQIALASAKTR